MNKYYDFIAKFISERDRVSEREEREERERERERERAVSWRSPVSAIQKTGVFI